MIYVAIDDTVTNVKNMRVALMAGAVPDTASFTIMIPDTEPTCGQVVQIYRDTTSNMIFAGRISAIIKDGFVPGEYQYHVDCIDYQKQLDRRLVAEAYENKTCLEIITDIVDNYTSGFTYNNVATGRTITKIVFNYIPAGKCIQELADLINFDWYVDSDKDIHFYDKETRIAPYQITDANLSTIIQNFQLTPNYSQVRNKIIVRGGYELSEFWSESRLGDGTTTAWTLAYYPHSISMTVDGDAVTLGIENVDEEDEYDYMYNYQEKFVRCSAGTSAPAADIVIVFTYKYEIPVVAHAANYASQAVIAAVEGGDGIIEHIVKDETLASREEAHDRAEMEISRWGAPMVSGSFATKNCHGWKPGQTITVDITDETLNGNYQITAVSIRQKGGNVSYIVNFSTVQYDLQQYLLNLANKANRVTFREDEIVDLFEILVESVEVGDSAIVVQLIPAVVKWGSVKWGMATWAAV